MRSYVSFTISEKSKCGFIPQQKITLDLLARLKRRLEFCLSCNNCKRCNVKNLSIDLHS